MLELARVTPSLQINTSIAINVLCNFNGLHKQTPPFPFSVFQQILSASATSMNIFHRPPPSSSAAKWLGLVSAVWVQSISGNNYTFSNYSTALKSLMHLSQLQLNNLSVAKDLGKAFGLLAGLASDRLPTSLLLLIGSLEGLIGYGAQWLVVSQKINPLPYWQVLCFKFC